MSNDALGSHESWNVSGIAIERELSRLHGMSSSLVAQYVKSITSKLPKDFASIEIGSGIGKMSFYSGLSGGEVHLLDSSVSVLSEARKLYDACNLSVKCHACDALELTHNLMDKFNLSLSLGVNEHFSGEARQKIFDAHFDVLKGGGYTVIAVPNRHCLSYRVAMVVWKVTGRWPKGLYEYGFSKAELMHRMNASGFKDIEILSGTYANQDFHHFISGNLKAALRKFGLMKKILISSPTSALAPTVEDIRKKSEQLSVPNKFCNHQSYTWIAIGKKQ